MGELPDQFEEVLEELVDDVLLFSHLQGLLVGDEHTLDGTEFSAHDALLDRLEKCGLFAQVPVPDFYLFEQADPVDYFGPDRFGGSNSGQLLREIELEFFDDVLKQVDQAHLVGTGAGDEGVLEGVLDAVTLAQQPHDQKL